MVIGAWYLPAGVTRGSGCSGSIRDQCRCAEAHQAIAATAQKIGLTQAAVSAQIARLESELGLELFDRTGRTANLNADGYQTLQQAHELIRMYNNLGSPAPETHAVQLITMGVIASIQRMLMPGALASFHAQWPNFRTRILPGLSMSLLDQLDAGEIDLA